MRQRAQSRLRGIEAKLERAEKHLNTLESFPADWTAADEPYALVSEVHYGKRRYIWHIRERKPVPPLPALLMDEVTHHLRSALDHLAGYLVEACGGEPTQATCWPVEGTGWRWKRNVERRRWRWQFWRRAGGGPLAGIPAGSPIWTFIESMQPYYGGGKAGEQPLLLLHERWNGYKHRILDPLWFQAGVVKECPLALFELLPPEAKPIESRWIIRPGQKIEDGTKIALFEFPLEKTLPVMKVKMDAKFLIQVAAGDKKGPPLYLKEVLELVRQIVDEATILAEAEEPQKGSSGFR